MKKRQHNYLSKCEKNQQRLMVKVHTFCLMLVAFLVISISGSDQCAHASTAVEDQNSTEMNQVNQNEPNDPFPPKENDKPENDDLGGLLHSNESQISISANLYQKIELVRNRFSNLFTYGAPLPPRKRNVSTDNRLKWQNEFVRTPLQLFMLLGSIFFISFCIEKLCRKYMTRFLPQTPMDNKLKWYQKLSAHTARTVLEACGLFIFLLSTVIILLCLPGTVRPHHVIIATTLTAIILVKLTVIISRTILEPNAQNLRLVPVTNETAHYIHNRVLIIANIGAFGWLVSVLIEPLSKFQSASFLSFVGTSTLVCFILIIMCLEKRQIVQNMLQDTLPKRKVVQEVARVWHQLAILYIISIWAACFFGLLLVGPKTVISATVTILTIPIFFFMDWILQSLVDWWLHLSKKDAEVFDSEELPSDINEVETSKESPDIADKAQWYSEGFTFSLRLFIRIALVALIFFNLLSLWGLDLEVGKVITTTVMNIIVATLICVIIWKIANRAIESSLKDELPDPDEEIEEGGAGGSRKGTLLLLFRKFLLTCLLTIALFTVLSSLGINIGPLIAGAGVIGLAIGFGAQTLVKDIISGVFFLMDDAFRVGDFVDTGSSQGTVEQISLRSLRIRHPRGMVHTIPFGDIPAVTNYSRDYIITKLDFRVPFDTDIDKIRKIVKKIYSDILSDEILAPKLLGKMKSQGVRELDDSALIMRIKFKSVPGEQFVLRREVFRRLQEAFQDNGLEFASRKVMVQMPKDEATSSSEKLAEAAAATVIAEQSQLK